ncbi:META domain-containing protein [Chitinophaga lutea]
MKKLFGMLAAALVLLSACTSSKKSTAVNNENDLYKTWNLVEVEGQAVDPAKYGRPLEFMFTKEGHRFSGSAGCNRIMGSFTVAAPNSLSFSQMASTKMACPDMALEDQFSKAIGKVSSWTITEGFLTLSDANGKSIAKFTAKN